GEAGWLSPDGGPRRAAPPPAGGPDELARDPRTTRRCVHHGAVVEHQSDAAHGGRALVRWKGRRVRTLPRPAAPHLRAARGGDLRWRAARAPPRRPAANPRCSPG